MNTFYSTPKTSELLQSKSLTALTSKNKAAADRNLLLWLESIRLKRVTHIFSFKFYTDFLYEI